MKNNENSNKFTQIFERKPARITKFREKAKKGGKRKAISKHGCKTGITSGRARRIYSEKWRISE